MSPGRSRLHAAGCGAARSVAQQPCSRQQPWHAVSLGVKGIEVRLAAQPLVKSYGAQAAAVKAVRAGLGAARAPSCAARRLSSSAVGRAGKAGSRVASAQDRWTSVHLGTRSGPAQRNGMQGAALRKQAGAGTGVSRAGSLSEAPWMALQRFAARGLTVAARRQ